MNSRFTAGGNSAGSSGGSIDRKFSVCCSTGRAGRKKSSLPSASVITQLGWNATPVILRLSVLSPA